MLSAAGVVVSDTPSFLSASGSAASSPLSNTNTPESNVEPLVNVIVSPTLTVATFTKSLTRSPNVSSNFVAAYVGWNTLTASAPLKPVLEIRSESNVYSPD